MSGNRDATTNERKRRRLADYKYNVDVDCEQGLFRGAGKAYFVLLSPLALGCLVLSCLCIEHSFASLWFFLLWSTIPPPAIHWWLGKYIIFKVSAV
jgi:hypothetical protein